MYLLYCKNCIHLTDEKECAEKHDIMLGMRGLINKNYFCPSFVGDKNINKIAVLKGSIKNNK